MADAQGTVDTSNTVGKQQEIDLRPTLFIGVGGTGMQVLLRMRRRILNNLWGNADQRVRIESLHDFPIAQFIHLDLDAGAVIEGDKAQADDLQFDLVKFSEEEKIVGSFDINKYIQDDSALEKYPIVKAWQPLTPRKLRETGMDPTTGAGQVRSVSRLYFFDQYPKIRDKIDQKLKFLKASLTNQPSLRKLGLKVEKSRVRVVVVASVAGGTGSGAFLDMGWLARWQAGLDADVELMLFLPTGYAGANKDRTQANGYAALMELESAMQGNKVHAGEWDPHEGKPEIKFDAPYSDVYLIDTTNVAKQGTKDIGDVYNMVADSLFEDFESGDFATQKRSVASNQKQHKLSRHDALVPKERFPDMKLSYSKRYSAFGHAVIDTRQEAGRDKLAHEWAAEMLKAFFGVGASDLGTRRATDKLRDEFMGTWMGLNAVSFSDVPRFSDKSIQLKLSQGEFSCHQLVDLLLADSHGGMIAGVEQRVNARMEQIRSDFSDTSQWGAQVGEAVKQLERDAVRDQDSSADTTEDRIAKRRRELLAAFKQSIRDELYKYLDNKEFAGLSYVLSLVEQIKDRIDAANGGLISALQLNADRYREIKDAVRTRELERLMANLQQTKSGFLGGLMGGGEKQATLVMDQLRTEVANGIKFHLRAKAADEAAKLLGEVSNWLGSKQGVDAQGKAVWSGLVGEFQDGRTAVLGMLSSLEKTNAILQRDLLKAHATLIHLDAPAPEIASPSAAQWREWADEAFKDFGGSLKIFPMLADAKRRTGLIAKVKHMADQKLMGHMQLQAGEDPLLVSLKRLSPSERADVFRRLLSCAMPWVDALLTGDTMVGADQYKCFIGVANVESFKVFEEALSDAVPQQVTLRGLQLVQTGQPGRLICYCELLGLPMTTLVGLDSWRASYRKEQELDKMPLHTHIDSTQFIHPKAPAPAELGHLAEDFKYFLLAVMTGVLSRFAQPFVPPGQYQFSVARGDIRRIGNERAIRQNGLPTTYREAILQRVQERLDGMDVQALIGVFAMCDHYENAVYTPKLITKDSTGQQDIRKGFASAVSGEAKQEIQKRVLRKGTDKQALDNVSNHLLGMLSTWTQPIPDSDGDADAWEVREPADGVPRLKVLMKAEYQEPGVLARLCAPVASAALMPAGGPPPLGGVAQRAYFLGINGQRHGPYPEEQLSVMLRGGQVQAVVTKVWREGLPDWVNLVDLPEFSQLSQPVSGVPSLNPSPPPLQ